jgi:hypothetical protein
MMVIAVALPVSLFLGLVSELLTGALQRMWSRGSPWWAPLAAFGTDVRLLVSNRDRISILEGAAAGAGLLGSTLAASAAVGAAPGSAPLLYLALLLGAVGGHAAASFSDFDRDEALAAHARREFALVEPAFLLALATAFVRWRAGDLDAVRGAQDVLGSGLEVGPPLAAGGLLLAASLIVAAGALRLPPTRGIEPGAAGGPSLIVTLCRWALTGAMVLTAAGFVAAGTEATHGGWPFEAGLRPVAAGAFAGVVLLAVVRAGLSRLPAALRPMAAWAAAILAAIAMELVLLA